MTISDYYELLNLKSDADEEDLKKAYRLKAKQYHPDINPAPGAKEDFIRIHHAYEIVNLFLKNKSFFIGLEEAYQKRAAEKAKNYARMKYDMYVRECEAYHNSPYAWIFKILYYGLYYLYIFCALVFAFIPIWAGVAAGLGYFFLCSPLYVAAYFTLVMAKGWKQEIDPLFN